MLSRLQHKPNRVLVSSTQGSSALWKESENLRGVATCVMMNSSRIITVLDGPLFDRRPYSSIALFTELVLRSLVLLTWTTQMTGVGSSSGRIGMGILAGVIGRVDIFNAINRNRRSGWLLPQHPVVWGRSLQVSRRKTCGEERRIPGVDGAVLALKKVQ